MAYMPCNNNWEKKDYTALAKRLIYAGTAALKVSDDKELEEARKFVARECQRYLENYKKNR